MGAAASRPSPSCPRPPVVAVSLMVALSSTAAIMFASASVPRRFVTVSHRMASSLAPSGGRHPALVAPDPVAQDIVQLSETKEPGTWDNCCRNDMFSLSEAARVTQQSGDDLGKVLGRSARNYFGAITGAKAIELGPERRKPVSDLLD